MNDERRAEILAAYQLYASIFDEVARRRARTTSIGIIAPEGRGPNGSTAGAGNGVPAPELSSRMHDVLRLIADGHSNKAIAARLSIGAETVKSHVHKLLSTLEAQNRAHAVGIAFRSGLLARSEPSEAA